MKFFILSFLVLAQSAWGLDQKEIQQRYDAIDLHSPETKIGLNLEERKALLKEVTNHPVVSLAKLNHYDPPPGEIGFCYGRAMAAHLLARKHGVARDGIVKLFVAGDMTPGPNQRWRFHVTTLVRDETGQHWYSIDPVVASLGNPEPLLPKDWLLAAKNEFDPKATTKNYVTNPDSIMVDMRVVPSVLAMENNERIIEVNFNPDRPGFSKENEVGDTGTYPVYRVDADASAKYFIKRHEVLEADDFNFLGIAVKILTATQVVNRAYDYRGYFSDLMTSLGE